MRRIRFLAAVTAVLSLSCNAGCRVSLNSPKMVLLHVIKQVQKDNWEEAYKYVTPDLYNLMQNLRTDIAVGVYNSKQKRKVIETINGDLAYVSVFFKNEDNPVTFYFKRADGKWKIDVPFKSNGEINVGDIIPYIEDGDFILSSEDHLSSYYIRSLSTVDQRFSHSGIIYKKNGVISVVGAEGFGDELKHIPSGVMEIPMDEYLQNKSNIGIYRAKSNNRKAYSNKAVEYIGVPFNYKYKLDNEKELYCTQLIQVVLRETNTPIKLKITYIEREEKDIILPDSISSSDDFEEIKYVKK